MYTLSMKFLFSRWDSSLSHLVELPQRKFNMRVAIIPTPTWFLCSEPPISNNGLLRSNSKGESFTHKSSEASETGLRMRITLRYTYVHDNVFVCKSPGSWYSKCAKYANGSDAAQRSTVDVENFWLIAWVKRKWLKWVGLTCDYLAVPFLFVVSFYLLAM